MRYFNLQWHITDRCQYNCVHCYRGGEVRKELSTAQMFKVIEDIRDTAMVLRMIDKTPVQPMINFTGGDPLLRKDFFDILDGCKDMDIDISGNADLITEEIADRLKGKIFNYGISIDGLEEVHDKRRGRGSYQRTIKVLGIFRKIGISTVVMMTIDENNRDEIIPLMKELEDKTYKFMVVDTVKLGNSKKSFGVSRDLLLYVDAFKPKSMALLYKDYCPLVNTLCIIPDGTVYPCRKIPQKIGKIPEERLWDIMSRGIKKECICVKSN